TQKKVDTDVEWYVQRHYPVDDVHGATENLKGDDDELLLTLKKDGTLISLNNGLKSQTVELWAHYNNHLYRSVVTLLGKPQTE
ncbi:hypothetical protein RFF73_11160, partial [Streptococcus ruminantium]|nr:hypothetical protein [Streptococcus ruminantium]